MKTKLFFIAFFSLSVFFVLSCNNSTKKTVSEQEQQETDLLIDNINDSDSAEQQTETENSVVDETPDIDTNPVFRGVNCDDFENGANVDIMVDNGTGTKISRSFILTLPKNITSKRDWPVIFSWHGVGDSAQNFVNLLNSYVDNKTMPFILVTPEDANYSVQKMPPDGVDWDNLVLKDGSAEAELFDVIYTCLDKKWGIDKKRVYTTGFSAGSIATDSLGVLRGEKIASILTFSGAYFSNTKDVDDLNEGLSIDISSYFSWPEMKTKNKYVQVLIHGKDGPKTCPNTECDIWGFDMYGSRFAINFNHMAINDTKYLNDLGHDVILCDHGLNHTVAGIPMMSVIQFFKDHPLGTTDSPYKTKMPEAFKKLCKFKEKTK